MLLRDMVGSSHVAGRYNFTDADYLNEGADKLLELGTRVIKVWFTPRPVQDFPFNSDWPEITSLVQLAKTPQFEACFAKPFSTFILETFAPGDTEHYFETGLTVGDIEREERAFYEITLHLMNAYRGSGKTFVLQNWESDWLLTNPEFTKRPSLVAIEAIREWINARQRGVSAARREMGDCGVTVAHAMEVNLVARAMDGHPTATNDIVPLTNCDLYSYSAYDTSILAPERFRDALDYLASKASPSELYGDRNIFIGEYGAPENEFDQREIVKRTVETSLDWGTRYVIYWQLYCNEPVHDYAGRPTNEDMRGFWLIRPDGSTSPAWEYLAYLLRACS